VEEPGAGRHGGLGRVREALHAMPSRFIRFPRLVSESLQRKFWFVPSYSKSLSADW